MLTLNYRDSKPIYEQVKDGFRKLILSGTLSTGDQLPSVRELAAQLAINPNTIQRAYRELEADGFIYSIPGKGSFASALSDVSDRRKTELLGAFDDTAAELLRLGITQEALIGRIQQLPEGGQV